MFKKIVSIFLVLGMILCVSACDNEKSPSKLTENQVSTEQSSEETQSQSSVEETTDNTETSTVTSTTQPANSQTINNKPTSNSQPKPSHTHSYSNATCTSPKKCSCGATAGTSLGHNYSSATCTSPKICSRCGTTSGSALGHSYSNATCTSPKTCSRCGNTNGGALGHNYVNNKCSRCGKVDPESLPKELFSTHPPYESKGCNICTVKINGETFANAFKMSGGFGDGSGAQAYFNIGGYYKKLTFEIGHVDNSGNDEETLDIILDGVLAKTITLKPTEFKKSYTINLNNAKQLVIKQSWSPSAYAIVNAQLSK